jgi:hypothetical protein
MRFGSSPPSPHVPQRTSSMSTPSGSSDSPSYTWSRRGTRMGRERRAETSRVRTPAGSPGSPGSSPRRSGWMTEKRALHRGHRVSIFAQRRMHGRQKRCAQLSRAPRRATSSWQMAHTSPKMRDWSASGGEGRGGDASDVAAEAGAGAGAGADPRRRVGGVIADAGGASTRGRGERGRRVPADMRARAPERAAEVWLGDRDVSDDASRRLSLVAVARALTRC